MTTSSAPRRIRPPSVGRFFVTFGYAWLTIGLFTGTLVLVVAVRGILDLINRFGWGQTVQDRVLLGVIVLFIIASFLLARAVVRALYRQPARTRNIALGALAIPAVASAYAWSNPTRFLTRFAGSASTSLRLRGGPSFIFGAYPDDDRLAQLKKQGVTTVISLQDPRVLVELEGIRAEKASAARLGLTLIEAPMLPWVSDNSASLEIVKNIALHGKGVYYVHCGLGRDRVNIVKRLVASLQPQTGARLAAAADLKHADGFESRTTPYQRGRHYRLGDGSWLVPMLNDDEFFGDVVEGTPGTVLLLLDPRVPEQALWMAKTEGLMRQYAIAFQVLPTSAGDTLRSARNPADATAAALSALLARVRAVKPPSTLVVPYTTFDTSLKAPLPRAVLEAYHVTPSAPAVASAHPVRGPANP